MEKTGLVYYNPQKGVLVTHYTTTDTYCLMTWGEGVKGRLYRFGRGSVHTPSKRYESTRELIANCQPIARETYLELEGEFYRSTKMYGYFKNTRYSTFNLKGYFDLEKLITETPNRIFFYRGTLIQLDFDLWKKYKIARALTGTEKNIKAPNVKYIQGVFPCITNE